MVLVPPYIDVDGLVVPLRVEPPVGDFPARVLSRSGDEAPLLEGLKYVISALIQKPAEEVLSLLRERKDVLQAQAIGAGPLAVEEIEDSMSAVKNWEKLTGHALDVSDAYYAGASFVKENIVIPRVTFIKLMTRLYEINDALREGRMEPRIDDSIPMPPPAPR